MRKEERLERKKNIRHFRDFEVYRWAFDAAMQIFEVADERFFKIVISVTREKLEPPALLKAPRTLSFLFPMRRTTREKSLSASGFAL